MFSKRIKRNLLRMRIDLLEYEEKKRYKASRLFLRIFVTLYLSLMVISLVSFIILKQSIEPATGNFLFFIIVIFSSMILPAILLIFPYKKLEKKYPMQSLGNIPNEIIE